MSFNLEKSAASLMVVAVFYLFGGGIILFTGEVDGSILAKLVWAMVYAVSGALAFLSSRTVLQSLQLSPGFLILAALCLVSILWTSDRSTTLSYSIAFFGATLAAYLLASKIEPLRLLRLAALAVFIIMLINFILMLPSLGSNLSSANRYSGIFPQPNVLGRITGLGVLLFVFLYFSGECSRWVFFGIGIGLCLIVACNSMTTVVAVTLSAGIFFLRRLIGRPLGSGHILIGVWFALCFGGLIWLSHEVVIEFIFGLLGRSTNMTGRTGLWDGLWSAILNKPILGYGYSGFWSGEPMLTQEVLRTAGWKTQSAHNGLLDIALHLGVVGVIVFLVVVTRTLIDGVKLAFGSTQSLGIILFSIVCYLLILGITESTYMMRNSIYWAMLVICAVYTQKLKLGTYMEDAP